MTINLPINPLPAQFRPKLRLGFNTRVSFNDDAGPAQGLKEGIELFKVAEALGYQSGWVYQRHFDHYLSSPLAFLPQRVSILKKSRWDLPYFRHGAARPL
jgi:hypothetical protein